jgi:uncharacterized protein (TIGR02466 family)
MEMLSVFATPFWIEDLELDITNIASTVKDIQRGSPGKQVSNVGGWQSKDLNSDSIREYTHLYNMVNILQKSIDNISTQIDPTLKMYINILWMNVNKKNDSNTPHYHPNSAFSGVLYIQCDSSSNIEFTHDTLMEHYPFKTNSQIFAKKFQLFPRVGRLIVFPSWIKHSVLPNESNNERISIAFNVSQREEYGEP